MKIEGVQEQINDYVRQIGGIIETVQRPSVGRIVFFYPAEGDKLLNLNSAACHPAIITRVWTDEMVNLTVLPDGEIEGQSSFRRTSVRLDSNDTSKSAHWSWPPRS